MRLTSPVLQHSGNDHAQLACDPFRAHALAYLPDQQMSKSETCHGAQSRANGERPLMTVGPVRWTGVPAGSALTNTMNLLKEISPSAQGFDSLDLIVRYFLDQSESGDVRIEG